MSRVESYNKAVFLILPDNTALQFETRREQKPPRIDETPAHRASVGDMLKSLMPRIARITPKMTVLPSGEIVSLASPSLPQ